MYFGHKNRSFKQQLVLKTIQNYANSILPAIVFPVVFIRSGVQIKYSFAFGFFILSIFVLLYIIVATFLQGLKYYKVLRAYNHDKEECMEYIYSRLRHHGLWIDKSNRKSLKISRFLKSFRIIHSIIYMGHAKTYNEYVEMSSMLAAEMNDTEL